jgi:hypothetical protein
MFFCLLSCIKTSLSIPRYSTTPARTNFQQKLNNAYKYRKEFRLANNQPLAIPRVLSRIYNCGKFSFFRSEKNLSRPREGLLQFLRTVDPLRVFTWFGAASPPSLSRICFCVEQRRVFTWFIPSVPSNWKLLSLLTIKYKCQIVLILK